MGDAVVGAAVGATVGGAVGAAVGDEEGTPVGVLVETIVVDKGVGMVVVGDGVGWSNTSPAATHRWSECGALSSLKCPPTCHGRRRAVSRK